MSEVVVGEQGQSFPVTRECHRTREWIPLRRRRRFVVRQEFAATSRNAPDVDVETFRTDQQAAVDHEADEYAWEVSVSRILNDRPDGATDSQ